MKKEKKNTYNELKNGDNNSQVTTEPATTLTQSNAIVPQTPPELSIAQVEVLEPPLGNLNQEICHSMNLINSSTEELHSHIKKLAKKDEEHEMPIVHRAHAAAETGKAIAQLIRTKLDLLKYIKPAGHK